MQPELHELFFVLSILQTTAEAAPPSYSLVSSLITILTSYFILHILHHMQPSHRTSFPLTIYGSISYTVTNQMPAEIWYLSQPQQPHGQNTSESVVADSCTPSVLPGALSLCSLIISSFLIPFSLEEKG